MEATLRVLAEVVSAPGRDDEPMFATRSFGAGQLALAVAGAVDAGAVERLRALLHEHVVRQLSARELVIDLSEVRRCEPGLARFLEGLRSCRKDEGCRVELRNPSEALGVALENATLTEAVTVYDAVRRRARAEASADQIAPRIDERLQYPGPKRVAPHRRAVGHEHRRSEV